MITVLRRYEENGFVITEYTKDGETISHRVKEPVALGEEPQEELRDSQLDRIESTLDLLLLKQEGIL